MHFTKVHRALKTNKASAPLIQYMLRIDAARPSAKVTIGSRIGL